MHWSAEQHAWWLSLDAEQKAALNFGGLDLPDQPLDQGAPPLLPQFKVMVEDFRLLRSYERAQLAYERLLGRVDTSAGPLQGVDVREYDVARAAIGLRDSTKLALDAHRSVITGHAPPSPS